MGDEYDEVHDLNNDYNTLTLNPFSQLILILFFSGFFEGVSQRAVKGLSLSLSTFGLGFGVLFILLLHIYHISTVKIVGGTHGIVGVPMVILLVHVFDFCIYFFSKIKF